MRTDHVRALFFAAGLVAILILAAAPAAAHPPSDLTLSYDDAAGELHATFTHNVEDTATHYVQSVWIEGPATFLVQNYTSQPSAGTFTYTYPLRLDPRTTITVRGDCNIGGEVVRSLALGTGTNTTPTITATAAQTTTAQTVTSPTTAPQTTAAPTTTAQAPGFAFTAACLALAVAFGGLLLAKR